MSAHRQINAAKQIHPFTSFSSVCWTKHPRNTRYDDIFWLGDELQIPLSEEYLWHSRFSLFSKHKDTKLLNQAENRTYIASFADAPNWGHICIFSTSSSFKWYSQIAFSTHAISIERRRNTKVSGNSAPTSAYSLREVPTKLFTSSDLVPRNSNNSSYTANGRKNSPPKRSIGIVFARSTSISLLRTDRA